MNHRWFKSVWVDVWQKPLSIIISLVMCEHRLSQLKVLELRENHVQTLPNSMMSLSQLHRLDLGTNDFQRMVSAQMLILYWHLTHEFTLCYEFGQFYDRLYWVTDLNYLVFCAICRRLLLLLPVFCVFIIPKDVWVILQQVIFLSDIISINTYLQFLEYL